MDEVLRDAKTEVTLQITLWVLEFQVLSNGQVKNKLQYGMIQKTQTRGQNQVEELLQNPGVSMKLYEWDEPPGNWCLARLSSVFPGL